jgi:hypothetical protein
LNPGGPWISLALFYPNIGRRDDQLPSRSGEIRGILPALPVHEIADRYRRRVPAAQDSLPAAVYLPSDRKLNS